MVNPIVMARIINCLRQAAGGLVLHAEILDYAYGGCEDGGPLWALGVIHHAVMELRRRGFPIESASGRGYRYRWVL